MDVSRWVICLCQKLQTRELAILLGLKNMSEQHFDRNTPWDHIGSTAVPVDLRSTRRHPIDEGLQPQGIHCGFCAESMIATKHGLAPVSKLSIGTPVLTRDHGYQPLAGLQRCPDASADSGLKTVLIRQGALGSGVPSEDIYMPAEHLLLVLDRPAEIGFREYLVRAKDLVQDRAGVRYQIRQTSIYAVLFERHEIILANGIWMSSSFRPPATYRSVLTAAQKALLSVEEPKPISMSRPVMTSACAEQRFSRTNRALGIYGSN